MKKIKFFLLISLMIAAYACKKESQLNKAAHNNFSAVVVDTSAVAVDSSALKRVMAEENTSIVYTEIKKVKKVSNYSEGPMQSFDFSFKNYIFKMKYIEDRAYIQYSKANKIIQGWQFCNANFYYDSSWETVEEDSHLLYHDADSSGVLLFPGFTEEYATYFVYEFNDNKLKYVNVVSLNTTLSAGLWTSPHEFRAVRKNNKLQISLLDKNGKEYVFEDGERDTEYDPGNPNISKDLTMLNNADNVK